MQPEVNDALIDKLSDLAKLQFEGPERERMAQDLQRMLEFVGKIQAVNTEGVQPLQHMTQAHNQYTPDEPVIDISHAEALKNAPLADSDYFRVPKFVDKE